MNHDPKDSPPHATVSRPDAPSSRPDASSSRPDASSSRPDLTVSPLAAGYDKVLVIRINHSYAGFFAYVTFAINQLIYAEKHNYLPVVLFGEWSTDGPNAFFDPARGTSSWDYYFEPVAGYTYDDIAACVADPDNPLGLDDLVFLTPEQAWYLHLEEPDSVFNYPYGYFQHKADYDAEWYEVQRDKAHDILSRYVRVKPHILEEVDDFVERYFDRPVLGLHLRGTDKGTAGASPHLMRIIPPASYFPYVDRYTEEHGNCRIFVATDQRQFLDQVRERYGDRVVALDAIRTTGVVNAFQTPNEKNYVKGREVLIDCLLLSRCDSLLKCSSAVGEYATYFNRDLPDIDLNHIGKRTSVLDPVKVAFARARQHFRIHWRTLRGMEGAPLREYLRLLLGYNPATLFIWTTVESRRYSGNPLWGALVSAKDYAWALASGEPRMMRYARHRAKVRRRRRGARHFDAKDARFLKYLEVRSDASFGTDLFGQFLVVLAQLHFAEAHGLEPVVNQDHAYHPNADPSRPGNVWDGYFEPVTRTRPEDLDGVDPGSIALVDPARQHSLWFSDRPTEPDDPDEARAWRRRTRLRGARLVERFVRVRGDLAGEVAAAAGSVAEAEVLGVVASAVRRYPVKGTPASEWEASPPLGVHDYTPHIDAYLEAHPRAKVLLVVEKGMPRAPFEERYGDRLVVSGGGGKVGGGGEVGEVGEVGGGGAGPWAQGRRAMLEALQLSRSTALIRGPSERADAVTFFNAELPVLDLGWAEPDWEV